MQVELELTDVRGLPYAIIQAVQLLAKLPIEYLAQNTGDRKSADLDPQVVTGGFSTVAYPSIESTFLGCPTLPPVLVSSVLVAEPSVRTVWHLFYYLH